jgi:hypothetical protein
LLIQTPEEFVDAFTELFLGKNKVGIASHCKFLNLVGGVSFRSLYFKLVKKHLLSKCLEQITAEIDAYYNF